MKKSALHISFVFLLFLSDFVISQSWLPVFHDTLIQNSNTLVLEGGGLYQGTGISNAFAKRFFYGGEISEDLKTQSLNRHRSSLNFFNVDLGVGAQFNFLANNLFKNPRYSYSIQMYHRNYLAMQYPKSLFQMLFFGNSSLENGVTSISGTRINSYDYQKIGFGVVDKKNHANLHLNLVNLRGHQFFYVYPGYIEQTLPDSVNLYINARSSLPSNTFSSYSQGLGLSVDFSKQFFILKDNNQALYFQFRLSDLGFAYLPQLEEYALDTVYRLDGESFAELSSPNSIFNTQGGLNEVLGLRSLSKGKTIVLPFTFQLSKDVDIMSSNKVQEFYGVRYRYLTEMQVYFGLNFNLVNKTSMKWHFGMNAAYGGGTILSFGSYSHLAFKNLQFGVVSENLLMRSGESLKIRLACTF